MAASKHRFYQYGKVDKKKHKDRLINANKIRWGNKRAIPQDEPQQNQQQQVQNQPAQQKSTLQWNIHCLARTQLLNLHLNNILKL